MKVGLIGCGAVGAKRALAIAGEHDIRLLADRDPARARHLAERCGGRAVPRWQALLDAGLDAVIVATYPDSHAEIACAMLPAGTAVLIEKPGGRNLEDALAIAAAARRSSVQAKVGFNHRFHPALASAKALLDEGALGEVRCLRARYGHGGRPGYESEWRFDPAISGGGETVDQGAHLIDLSRWYLGDLKLGFAATPTYFWPGEVEDNCFLALQGATDRTAWLHAGWTEWKNGFRLDLIADRAMLSIEGLGGSYGTERLTVHRMLLELGPPESEVIEYGAPDRSWALEWAAFTASTNEEMTEIADIEDAVAVWRLIEAAYAFTGR